MERAAWLRLRRMLANETVDARRLLWEYKLRPSLKEPLRRIWPCGRGWRLEPLVVVMIWMLIARFPIDSDENTKKDGRIVNLKALQMTTC